MAYTPKVERIITLFVPGVLAVGSTGVRWYNRTSFPIAILGVAASVGQAPTGTSIIADVNIDDVSMFGATRPEIPAGAFISPRLTPATQALPVGSYLTIDLDQIGSTGAGADLVVQVMF